MSNQIVYNINKVWYNQIVKKIFLTIAALLCAAGIFGGVSAYAASQTTVYPEREEFLKRLEFTSLVDYAVKGEEIVFAETIEGGSKLTDYNGETSSYVNTEKTVAKLDCDGENFYYADTENKSYLLDGSESQYVFSETEELVWREHLMYVFYDGVLNVVNLKDHSVTEMDAGFSKVKIYGDAVYALKGNSLCRFNGTSYEEIVIEYYSFEATKTLSVGTAAADLKDYELAFITVKQGNYITEVDLSKLDGEYFEVGETFAADKDFTALLLADTGNAVIFSVGEKSYITKSSYTEKLTDTFLTESTFNGATVTGSAIYASPYVTTGTSVLYPAAGKIVKILGKLETDILDAVYYQVEYTEGESKKVGFVAEGFLTEYIIEDNKEPSIIPDANYSDKNDVRTVLLILLVIVLVLVAVGYLTYVGTKGKGKKENNATKTQKEKN